MRLRAVPYARGVTRLSELSGSRELMANLTLRELRSKYKRSALGWAWSLLNPLATMLIFTVVFEFFLHVNPDRGRPSGLKSFPFFLLVGLVPWNFLANGVNGSMSALLANSNLVKKVYFPRETLIAANVASFIVALLIELGVLAVALVIAGNFVLPWLVPTLLLVAVQAVFVFGLGLALGVLNVYFRDVQHLVGGILLQLWFYATPIVYPPGFVHGEIHLFGHVVAVRTLYDLNPMVRFVRAYRNLLYDLRMPALADWAYVVAAALVALGLGAVVFTRLEPKLAEEL